MRILAKQMPTALFTPTIFLIAYSLLLIIFGNNNFSSALRCYQGLQTINAPLNGTPIDCPMPNMLTCTKTVDLRSNLITRTCSSGNCTVSRKLNQSFSIYMIIWLVYMTSLVINLLNKSLRLTLPIPVAKYLLYQVEKIDLLKFLCF